MSNKPILVYVDDEDKNLSLFDILLSESYHLYLFPNAIEALKDLKNLNPHVVVSDQRMPGMTGLEFLEVASQLVPTAPRIILTGQTDEDTMLKLVRRAKLFDYITKPLVEDELISSLLKATEFSLGQRHLAQAIAEKDALYQELLEKKEVVENTNRELKLRNTELELARMKEAKAREEAEAWSSIEIVRAMQDQTVKFPIRRDLVCITYDIISSSKLHGVTIDNKDLRGHVLNLFTTSLLKYGGIQESHSGDSAFGHFGVFGGEQHAKLALAVGQEFRSSLRNLSRVHNVDIECGVAINFAENTIVNVHEIHTENTSGTVVKKFISSVSPQIDKLFRMEKLLHTLPGTNILLTEEIAKFIDDQSKFVKLGRPTTIHESENLVVYAILSDFVKTDELIEFKKKYFSDEDSVVLKRVS